MWNELAHCARRQWRIWGMAGTARAMDATLTGGAKIAWQNNNLYV